ncbi:MAG TPA: hemolysin [Cyanobacteria bacterium UBA11371]|nr:hemolysin [Cyanobacteria bacterium UBA11371]
MAQLFTINQYTPNSDLAAGFRPSQLIFARTGNDTILGYQPIVTTPNQTQIDLINGDLTVEDPGFRSWNDTFILGEWQKPYYANGNPEILGLNDFALLTDFNPLQDIIQLHGTANDYFLVDIGLGSAIVQPQQTGFDVISFLLGNSNLNLAANYFNYQGNTAPQGPVLPQTRQLGTSGFDLSATTATDPFGNIYIAGGTTGSLAGSNNGESRDAFVAKYDNQGNLLFTKQVGTSDIDTISGIATDKQGNFYVSGITAGNLASPKQASSTDAWVAKYDSNGNQLWIRQFGENIIFQAFSIDVDDNGNAYLSGIDVRSSIEIATDDFWVTKFDTNGNQLWFTKTGSVDDAFDESYRVTVGKDGSVYATGWTLGDLAGTNAGIYDAWLGKFDNNSGQLQWLKQFGTPDYDWAWGVDTDSQGNVYAAGWTLGNLGGNSAGTYDSWLTKYDSQGNRQWIKQFGSAGDDQAFHLNIDSQDNIFLTGYTNSNLGGNNAGSYDPWVARFDTNGNQLWLQQFGTSQFEQAYGITSDNFGNLFVTGVTQGSLGTNNAGSFDTWLAKLDSTSGNLLSFAGNQQPSDISTVADFLELYPSLRELSSQQVDFMESFFEDFLVSTGIGIDGSGLVKLAGNSYQQPTPTSIPEPSSVVGLAMVAAIACIGAMLSNRQKIKQCP